MKHSLSVALLALVILSGCGTTSSIMESKKVDYKSAGKLPSLEIPPDLTAPTQDDRFAVPDVAPAKGSATFSAYDKERSGQKTTTTASSPLLLPTQDKVSFQRAGSQRWLVVKAKPDEVWPMVKEFWQENGFLVSIEKPEAGVMETDWAENRAKIPQDFIRNALGKVLDGLYSTAERDKFRTRLEAGAETDTTEIYISHRGMSEQLEGGGSPGSARTIWQPRPADPELEAEFLRRLMVRFGVEQARAQAMLTTDGTRERAKLVKAQDGTGNLDLAEPFDRAWRRVGLALDRVGFTVEDRDRSKGLYFVRYVDPDADGAKKDDKGFLSKLTFWKSDKKDSSAAQYRIQVASVGGNSEIRVLDKSGSKEKSDTASRILNLLHEQLK